MFMGNVSEANIVWPDTKSFIPMNGPAFNINIQNNPNINNEVNVENNNNNTNNNENNNTNKNENQNQNTNKNENKNQNTNKNDNENNNTNKNKNNNANTNKNENKNENKKEKEKPTPPSIKNAIDGSAVISQPDSNNPRKIRVNGWTNTDLVKVKIGTHEHSIKVSNPSRSKQNFDETFTLPDSLSGTLQGHVNAVGNQGKTKQIGQGTVTIKGKEPPPEPVAAHDPQGEVEFLSYDEKTKRLILNGWAYDEDNKNAPVNVRVYVGGDRNTAGAKVFDLTANQYHKVNGQHGFKGSFPLPDGLGGEQPVYVYALNLAGTKGSDQKIGQGTIDIKPVSEWMYAHIPNGWYNIGVAGQSSPSRLIGTGETNSETVQLPSGMSSGKNRRFIFYLENVGNNIFTLKQDGKYVTLRSGSTVLTSGSGGSSSQWRLMYDKNSPSVKTGVNYYGEYFLESMASVGSTLTGHWNGEAMDLTAAPAKDSQGRSDCLWNFIPASQPAPEIPEINGNADTALLVQRQFKVWGWTNTDRVKVKTSGMDDDVISIENPNHENKTFEKVYTFPDHLSGSQSVEIDAFNSSDAGKTKRIGNGTFKIESKAHKPTGQFQYLDGIETNRIRVQGWAKDEDVQNSVLRVHIYVGGGTGSGASSYEIQTDASGKFDSTLPVDRSGWQDVYAYAIDNDGRADSPEIGHGRVFIPWLGWATERRDVYTDKECRVQGRDKKGSGEKVFGRNHFYTGYPGDEVTVLYEEDGAYYIRYHSDTDGYDKERWIKVSGSGIVPR